MKMKEIVREKNGKQEPEDEPSPMMPEQRAYKRAKWESDLLELDKRAREEERKECAAKLQAKEAGARAKKLRKKMQDILSMGSENYVGETPLFDGLEDEPADGRERCVLLYQRDSSSGRARGHERVALGEPTAQAVGELCACCAGAVVRSSGRLVHPRRLAGASCVCSA